MLEQFLCALFQSFLSPPCLCSPFPCCLFSGTQGPKMLVTSVRTNEFSAANNRSQILKISESVEGKPQIERDLEEIVPTIDFCAPFQEAQRKSHTKPKYASLLIAAELEGRLIQDPNAECGRGWWFQNHIPEKLLMLCSGRKTRAHQEECDMGSLEEAKSQEYLLHLQG